MARFYRGCLGLLDLSGISRYRGMCRAPRFVCLAMGRRAFVSVNVGMRSWSLCVNVQRSEFCLT